MLQDTTLAINDTRDLYVLVTHAYEKEKLTGMYTGGVKRKLLPGLRERNNSSKK